MEVLDMSGMRGREGDYRRRPKEPQTEVYTGCGVWST